MTKRRFTPLDNEIVLVEAKVGKRILGVYCLIFFFLAFNGIGLLIGGTLAYLKNVSNASSIIIVGIACFIAIFLAAGHYVSTKNRRYVLTDKRIVILRGGKIKRSNRSLSLQSVHGVEKDNNLIYNWFGLATIDFYAMAAASNTTKFKLLSFSSTNFKFQWVDKNDADAVYALMQNYIVNGDFEQKTFTSDIQNDFTENETDKD